MSKIIVLGNGFIASHLPYNKITDRLENDSTQIRSILEKYKPTHIINTIGYCGNPNIDSCENEKEKTIISNITIPTLLALESQKLGIHMIHVGSGCIFYGESPDNGWKEDDPTFPISLYSKSKYACDLSIGSLDNVCVLRIRMPVSDKNHSRNLLSKIVKYAEEGRPIIDVPNSITFMDELARGITWVLNNKKNGIYHFTNPEPLRHSTFLNHYFKLAYNLDNYPVDYEREEFIFNSYMDTKGHTRRSNCILDNSKIQNEGFVFKRANIQAYNCVRNFWKNSLSDKG